MFIITEESAPEGYINVLEGLKIKLTVSVNNGTLNFQRAIYRGDENVTITIIIMYGLNTLKIKMVQLNWQYQLAILQI